MKNNKLQTLSNQRMTEILRFYPNAINLSTSFFTIDQEYSCQELNDRQFPIGAVYLIMNIRGKVSQDFYPRTIGLSDYQIFNADFEKDIIYFSNNGWDAQVYFSGEDIKYALQYSIIDNMGYKPPIRPMENFYFADAIHAFYKGILDISDNFSSWKDFKKHKKYDENIQRLRTGFFTHEKPMKRKYKF
ncbi:MAG: hypothetical protein ACI85O_001356 [Saprospiraceae bacterium]|jgi:hypothetical protein